MKEYSKKDLEKIFEARRNALADYLTQNETGACVFIDDSPANVEAAMCTGMHAIQFRGDVGRLRRELRALGVKVAEATQSEPEMV